jgi:COMPASS component SWD3
VPCKGICAFRTRTKFDGSNAPSALTTSNPRLTMKNTTQYQRTGTLGGHSAGVTACRFSVDGKFLCSSSTDRSVIVRETTNGGRVSLLQKTMKENGHTSGISDVAWHCTNDYICTASDDKSLKVWDVERGEVLLTLGSTWNNTVAESHTREVTCVDISPQGHLIGSGSTDMTVRLWDVRTGKCVQTIEAHSEKISSVDFNWNGSKFVSSSYDGITRLWDTGSGMCLQSMVPPPKSATDDRVFNATAARFSPNGQYILSGIMDSSIRLWDTNTGNCLRTYTGGHTNEHYAGFSAFCKATGMHIFVGSENGEVAIYNLHSCDVAQTVPAAHKSPVIALDSHPRKKMFAYGSIEGLGELHIFSAQ